MNQLRFLQTESRAETGPGVLDGNYSGLGSGPQHVRVKVGVSVHGAPQYTQPVG